MSSAPEKKQKRLHLMSLISSLGCCHSLPDFLFPIFIFIFLSVIARFKEKLHLAGTFYFTKYLHFGFPLHFVFLLVRLHEDHVKIFSAPFAAHSFQIWSSLLLLAQALRPSVAAGCRWVTESWQWTMWRSTPCIMATLSTSSRRADTASPSPSDPR